MLLQEIIKLFRGVRSHLFYLITFIPILILFFVMLPAFRTNAKNFSDSGYTIFGNVALSDNSPLGATYEISDGIDRISSQKITSADGAFNYLVHSQNSYTISVYQEGYDSYQNNIFVYNDTHLSIKLNKIILPPQNALTGTEPQTQELEPATPVQPKEVTLQKSLPAKSNISRRESSYLLILDGKGITSQLNLARQQNGLNNIVLNSSLSKSAAAKAFDMNSKNYFAHTARDGTDDFYFINQSGYPWTHAGINLAEGDFSDAKDLIDAWMASPGHRENILASYGKQVGIGISGKYIVMMIAD